CLFYNFSQVIGHGAMVDSPPTGGGAHAFLLVGIANLPVYPCSIGSLLAPGCGGASFTLNPMLSSGVTAVIIDGYYEPCVPTAGSAVGRIVFTDGVTRNFFWLRTGSTATIEISNGGQATGAGSGTFIPVSSANCVTGPTAMSATVVAHGASS
ncbi:MAG TPA: hypothetical protein VG245_03655, partial [Candidatus Dormibacteraeota bacterium]|nr:hypothetical protein [Candidatus Dormibacteraeota bacterium]